MSRYLSLVLLLAALVIACTSDGESDLEAGAVQTAVAPLPTTTASPTPAPTSTATLTPEPTSPPPSVPAPELHFDASDLLGALDEQDIRVTPTGETVACDVVEGLPGLEYDGDVRFALWVYPNVDAVLAEWIVEPYVARHPVLACNQPPARIYSRGNMVLWVSAETRYDEIAIRVGETFLALDGRPLPAGGGDPVLASPVEGEPFGSSTLLKALFALGLSYTPYESWYCQPEQGSFLFMLGPHSGEGPSANFEFWVSPTVAALEAEWGLEAGGLDGQLTRYTMQNRLCRHPLPGTIYRNQNMLLMIPGGTSSLPAEAEALVIDAFLSLQP
jgi:hypothetical protein